jgi:AbrB family looped-hinge helix DNA binding protein
MTYITTLTSKGQVTIPIDIRRFLGISSPQEIAFVKRKKEVLIKPVVDFLSLKGSIKSKKKYSDKEADKAIARLVAKNYKRKK